MGNPVVLLFSAAGGDSGWVAEARRFCTVHRVRSADEIDSRIKLLCPHVMCFELGRHDPAVLALLQLTKQSHPSLPVLLITEERSEALAVWALRARVWNYLVKPVDMRELYCSILTLHESVTAAGASGARRMLRPEKRLRARVGAPPARNRAEALVDKVRVYVAQRLSEKILETELAQHCAMSYFHFSRTFRRVAGVTLREYILRERVHRAARLLQQAPGLSVKAVAFEAGFRDLSHFARMFRRYQGISPSEYRKAGAGCALHAPPPVGPMAAEGPV
ncbi:MAG TPA: DNA-binding response regulator [Sulfuricaulis sp.]|nr:DNA-binding response regulator [Sulfuricaulis sp.]